MSQVPNNSVKIQDDEWYMIFDGRDDVKQLFTAEAGLEFLRGQLATSLMIHKNSWDWDSGITEVKPMEVYTPRIRFIRGGYLKEEIFNGKIEE